MNGSEFPQPASKSEIEWTPLLIVIGAAYLISLSVYGAITGVHDDSFELETNLSLVLSFLASTVLIATIASVIYKREDWGKMSLIIGMVLTICMLALRTSVYLRV